MSVGPHEKMLTFRVTEAQWKLIRNALRAHPERLRGISHFAREGAGGVTIGERFRPRPEEIKAATAMYEHLRAGGELSIEEKLDALLMAVKQLQGVAEDLLYRVDRLENRPRGDS